MVIEGSGVVVRCISYGKWGCVQKNGLKMGSVKKAGNKIAVPGFFFMKIDFYQLLFLPLKFADILSPQLSGRHASTGDALKHIIVSFKTS